MRDPKDPRDPRSEAEKARADLMRNDAMGMAVPGKSPRTSAFGDAADLRRPDQKTEQRVEPHERDIEAAQPDADPDDRERTLAFHENALP